MVDWSIKIKVVIGVVYVFSVIFTYFTQRAWLKERCASRDPELIDLIVLFFPIINVFFSFILMEQLESKPQAKWFKKFYRM